MKIIKTVLLLIGIVNICIGQIYVNQFNNIGIGTESANNQAYKLKVSGNINHTALFSSTYNGSSNFKYAGYFQGFNKANGAYFTSQK